MSVLSIFFHVFFFNLVSFDKNCTGVFENACGGYQGLEEGPCYTVFVDHHLIQMSGDVSTFPLAFKFCKAILEAAKLVSTRMSDSKFLLLGGSFWCCPK